MKSLLVLGRQPGLSLAELESLLGPEHLQPFGQHCLSSLDTADIPFKRLGGTIKTARLLVELPSPKWADIENYLIEKVPPHTKHLPEGKFTLGLSVYGLSIKPEIINKTGLKLKKLIKKTGRPVRVVPNKASELNSAQVLNNKLTSRGAWELLVVSDGRDAYLAQTMFVQDINAYSARDQVRPKRDALVGMLPPKLAQIIVNLATTNRNPEKGAIVYDPFCGTGVVLQEAALMGYEIKGSDINPKMVEFTDTNLQWLKTHLKNIAVHSEDGRYYELKVLDAAKDSLIGGDFIASEVYLGPVLKGRSNQADVNTAVGEVNDLLIKFLKNIHFSQFERMCLAVPCWSLDKRFYHLPLLDQLSDLGYNRLSFVHAGAKETIYHRPGQAVAREILVLKKL